MWVRAIRGGFVKGNGRGNSYMRSIQNLTVARAHATKLRKTHRTAREPDFVLALVWNRRRRKNYGRYRAKGVWPLPWHLINAGLLADILYIPKSHKPRGSNPYGKDNSGRKKGSSILLKWTPFETTTFRDGIVTGTLESSPLFRNANTLGLFWDLH